jgi:RND family efflux transporter MFP subunit
MERHARKRSLVALACLASLTVAGCHRGETESQGPEQPVVGVVRPVVRSVPEYVAFTGQIQAVESVDLRARVTGYLKTVCYAPGSMVAKDTVLFEIDPTLYQAQVDTAKGRLAEAKSQIAVAKAKVAQAEAQLSLDRTKMAIDKEVAKTSGAVSKLKLEEDDSRVKESEATVEQCKANVLALEASAQAAAANLESNQLHLDWTKVSSPIDGRVDRNLITVGNLVTADTTMLTNIVATGKVYVYFDVDELTCLKIQKEVRDSNYDPRQVPIAVALQDERDYPHAGTLDLVANRLNETTGTLKVRGVLKNEKRQLTPGNFVRVRVVIDDPRDRLMVPDRAVILEQDKTFALVVGNDDAVEKREVTIGSLDPNDATMRAVDKGLKPDDRVIVEGRQYARRGMKVKVKEMSTDKSEAKNK